MTTAIDKTAFHDARAIELANRAAQVHELCKLIEASPVADQAAYDDLGNVAKGAAATFKELDKARRVITDPLRLEKERIDEYYRPALDAYKALERAAKARMVRHVEETRKAAHDAQAAAGAAFAAGDTDGAHAALATMPAPAHTEGVSMREVVDFEVFAPGQVPYELCSPDPAKIEAEIKRQGGKGAAISGVRVFTKLVPAVRTK